MRGITPARPTVERRLECCRRLANQPAAPSGCYPAVLKRHSSQIFAGFGHVLKIQVLAHLLTRPRSSAPRSCSTGGERRKGTYSGTDSVIKSAWPLRCTSLVAAHAKWHWVEAPPHHAARIAIS